MLRFVGRIGRAVRAHPGRAALVVVGLALAAVLGTYYYARAEWRAAQAAVREARPEEARQRLAFCRKVWPRSVEVHILSARAARLCGDYQEAEAYLSRCLELQGGANDAIQLEFLLMRTQTGEVEEVTPSLIALVDSNHPDSLLILETMARTYMHGLRYGPAYQCLNRWIAISPDDARPYQWRGWVMERMNHPARAEEDYQRSLDLNPDQPLLRLRLAEMYLEDKLPLAALPHLEYLRAREPDRADVKARLGQCRFLQGRTQEARELLMAAIAQLPDDLPVQIHLAKLDLEDSRPAEAEKRLRRVLTIDPFDTEAQYNLSLALRAQRRRAEADAAMALHDKNRALLDRSNKLLAAEAEHPTRGPDAAYEIGTALLQVGQERIGVHWLEQALQRDPTHVATHRALAEFFERKGDKERAAEHRRWAPSPEPK